MQLGIMDHTPLPNSTSHKSPAVISFSLLSHITLLIEYTGCIRVRYTREISAPHSSVFGALAGMESGMNPLKRVPSRQPSAGKTHETEEETGGQTERSLTLARHSCARRQTTTTTRPRWSASDSPLVKSCFHCSCR
jgi:hypothetical protein